MESDHRQSSSEDDEENIDHTDQGRTLSDEENQDPPLDESALDVFAEFEGDDVNDDIDVDDDLEDDFEDSSPESESTFYTQVPV
jgi:hypothetical protein